MSDIAECPLDLSVRIPHKHLRRALPILIFRSIPTFISYSFVILLHLSMVYYLNKILWDIDQLLSGDSVNSDRFWATAQ
jgi:hypothetical protein